MTSERRGGPVSMSADELTDFLSESPTGAICVVDDDGNLLALPSRVVDFDNTTVAVDVSGIEANASPSRNTPVCLVADTFTAYHAIRGVILQGTVAWPPTAHDVVNMTVTRTVTFSFANA
jgi:sarcosine oxidase gamma subunit